jgi:hypothetical protein
MPHVVVLVVVVVVVLVVVMVAEVTGAPSASPARADVDEFLCASSISWAVAIGRECYSLSLSCVVGTAVLWIVERVGHRN